MLVLVGWCWCSSAGDNSKVVVCGNIACVVGWFGRLVLVLVGKVGKLRDERTFSHALPKVKSPLF